jgi:hypothetical protein
MKSASDHPVGKAYEHRPSASIAANGDETILDIRMLQVRRDARVVEQHVLDIGFGSPVLAAFRPVASVPLDACYRH